MFNHFHITLLRHDLKCLVTLATTVTMEIEVEDLETLVLRVVLVDVPNELSRNTHLFGSGVPEKVYDVAGPIRVKDTLEVPSERSLVHLWSPRQEYFFLESALFPKDRH